MIALLYWASVINSIALAKEIVKSISQPLAIIEDITYNEIPNLYFLK